MKSVPPPNYTQAPNLFFDELLTQIDSLAELKVTLAIIRQTFGYHKKESELSVSRLEELTGLSRRAVFDGLKLALKRGHVERREQGQSYLYRLNVDAQLVQDLHQSQPCTSADIAPEVVQGAHPQPMQTLHPPIDKEINTKETERNSSATPTATRRAAAKKPGGGTPHRRDVKSRDPRSNFPAIRLIKQLTGYRPRLILYDKIIDVLGDHPDFNRARECAVEWASRGFRMDNHGWVFDWYVNGIPPKNGNGNARHGPRQSNVEKSMEAVRNYIAEEEAKCQHSGRT